MLRRACLLTAAVALGAALLAVPGVLPGPAATPVPETVPRVAAVTGAPAAPEPPSEDARAGVLGSEVPPVGTGVPVVVPGSAPAPGPGRVRTVRVEVEGGLPVDGPAFADFVLDTLNDPRGWGRDGSMSFARTDGDAEVTVVLASPDTSARLCLPLRTGGTLSCRNGPLVVLTHHRWVLAHPDYGTDRTAYRQYVVNHEVGHFLGHGHVPCPGPDVAAPVMMQQTKGLLGCAPNPWPYP
ncbi:DUF3152 domain-containing protein [Pseudonocardia sp.]|uniref:DUF3152 domain-containing protein n=1 Tax=Pseudonocardia sp. TaxID=60912 RepID=UPI00262287D9|nr:DUF3152 domain-containing protein [Pseudonocardia sp.]